MADNGSVIIDASLNATAMESAINTLVADVDKKLSDLAGKVKQNMDSIQQSLDQVKGSRRRSSSGGSSSKETEDIKQETQSYDALAQAMRRAAQEKGALFTRNTNMGVREQAAQIAQQLNDAKQALDATIQNVVSGLQAKIEKDKAKIHELGIELTKLQMQQQQTGNFSTTQPQILRLQEQIEDRYKHIADLQKRIEAAPVSLAATEEARRNVERLTNAYQSLFTTMNSKSGAGSTATQAIQEQVKATKQLGQSQEEIARQTAEEEARKRDEIMKTGLAAQKSAQQLMSSMSDALATGNNGQSILGLRQLDQAIKDMRNAYYGMGAEKESPIGQSLKRDLDYAEQLRAAVKGFNMRLTGMVDTSSISEELRSLTQLKSELKDLSRTYSLMTSRERESAAGRELIEKYQRLSREAQKVQSQLNRPLSLDAALKLPTTTLDEIIYKMQQLSNYRLNIKVGENGTSQEIQQVNKALADLEQRKKTLLGQNEQVKQSNNALTRSFNYMKNRLAFYFTVGASTQFVKQLIEIRAQYEMLEKSIGILVGSMQEGSRIFAELNAMAIKSPFTTMELGEAAKQLSAYDVAAKDVVNTTKRLADMAAAVGVPIQRLTYALGQVKAYDYLNARDARMFAQAGIPLVRELAQYYTELEGKMVSTADIYARMKKHMISYNDTMAVVNKMTDEGGKFFNYQEKMAGTLKVQLANLTLAWNNMLNSIGKDNQGLITFPIKALKTLFKEWTNISNALRDVAIAFGIVKVAQIANIAYTAKVSAGTAVATATNWKFVDSLVAMRSGFAKLVASPMTWWTLLASVVVGAGMAIWDANDAIKEFNRSISERSKENVENIKTFLKDYSEIREKLQMQENGQFGTLSEDEAVKTWDAIREQIEMTSGASEILIGNLMSITDVNDRVRESFNYLDMISKVQYAMEKMDKDTIFIQQDYSQWWSLWQGFDSLYENVQDYTKSLKEVEKETEEITKETNGFWEQYNQYNKKISEDLKKAENESEIALNTLRINLDETNESITKFIKSKQWNEQPEYINEVFGNIGKKIIEEGLNQGWDEQDVLNFQLEFEEYRSKAAKEATQKRLENEKQQFLDTEDEKTRIAIRAQIDRDQAQLNAWEQNNGRGRILWNEFTNWMAETQTSRVQTMYSKMTDNGKHAIDYTSKEWKEFVNDMADKFATENKLSQDDAFNHLKKWVADANKMKIFIELIIGTGGGKSVYEELTDLDKKADEAYNRRKRLNERLQDLNKKIAQATKERDYNTLNVLYNEREKVLKEETEANDDYNKSIEQGGKSKAAEAAANKAAAAANKKNAAAKRAQAKAESELQKALKEELQIIDKVQSSYKTMTKTGASRAEALEVATSGFEKSTNSINKVFEKWQLDLFDPKKFAGISNPRKLLTMLENQLNTLVQSGRAKPEEIKDLEVKIKDLRVEAEKFDLEAVTKGLNNELDKIKEEYELAVALEANPELGGIFADLLGISQDELDQLPKDWQAMLNKLQAEVNREVGGFDLSENLNKANFDAWVKSMGLEMDSELVKTLDKIRETVNKARQDETKKIIDDWNKLLEKYSEYEYKRNQIALQAEREREMARKNNAGKEIVNAINRKEQQALAKLDFDEFQKSATWITATGNLSNLTDKALDLLIQRINEYKKQAKNLEPKEILKLNKALRQLRKEQMRNNPFKIYAIAAQEAKDRTDEYDAQIAELQQQINDLGLVAKRKEGIVITEDELKILNELLEKIAKLKQEKEEVSKIPLEKKAEQVQQYVNYFKQFSDAFSSFASSTNSQELKQVAKAISDVTDVISAAVSGAAAGGWIGAIVGGVSALIPKILDWTSGNDSINASIERSQLAVKKLENNYKKLEYAAEKAYGVEAYGAQKAMIYNKQLQLAELEHQLQREKDRKGKYKDYSAIADLEGQIIDLKNEINDATEDIVNDLLGISSKGDFAENLVKDMIAAFKQGEDYMKVFEESFEDMVDNMIMKAIVSRLVGDWINKIWNQVETKAAQSDRALAAQAEIERLQNLIKQYQSGSVTQGRRHLTDEEIASAVAALEEELADAIDAYNAAITPTPEDIAGMRELFEAGREDFKNNFLAYMDAFGIQFGESAGKADLSALQQGIQGITEDTAGALEAYMNSVSQQVYLHSDLLTQIRDILINFGGDVTIATNAQILLQLQNSYILMQTMTSLMQGWTNPSGNGIRVELLP